MVLHTDSQYEAELGELRRQVLAMGGIVEKQIEDAVRAFVSRSADAVNAIRDMDDEVDRHDVEIEALCLRVLALRQPAARDLRFITTALRITTDLERIGDRGVSIAERAAELAREPGALLEIDLPRLAERALAMLRQSLDAFVREDVALAKDVPRMDDEVDRLHRRNFDALQEHMTRCPDAVARTLPLLFVSKYLERIGDHATNIGEMVVFMVEGKSVRHPAVTPE